MGPGPRVVGLAVPSARAEVRRTRKTTTCCTPRALRPCRGSPVEFGPDIGTGRCPSPAQRFVGPRPGPLAQPCVPSAVQRFAEPAGAHAGDRLVPSACAEVRQRRRTARGPGALCPRRGSPYQPARMLGIGWFSPPAQRFAGRGDGVDAAAGALSARTKVRRRWWAGWEPTVRALRSYKGSPNAGWNALRPTKCTLPVQRFADGAGAVQRAGAVPSTRAEVRRGDTSVRTSGPCALRPRRGSPGDPMLSSAQFECPPPAQRFALVCPLPVQRFAADRGRHDGHGWVLSARAEVRASPPPCSPRCPPPAQRFAAVGAPLARLGLVPSARAEVRRPRTGPRPYGGRALRPCRGSPQLAQNWVRIVACSSPPAEVCWPRLPRLRRLPCTLRSRGELLRPRWRAHGHRRRGPPRRASCWQWQAGSWLARARSAHRFRTGLVRG